MHITALRLTRREAQLVPEQNVFHTLHSPHVRPGDDAQWAEHWLDVTDCPPEDWERLLETLGMSEGDREVGMETRRFPQAEILTGGVALRLPVRDRWLDDRATYINVILLNNMLRTQHDGELAPLDKTRRRLLEGDRPDIDTMPGLMLYVLEGIMEADVNDFILARGQVEEQEDHVEADDADDEVIRRLKHSVEHLTSQSEEQLFCLTLLRGLLAHDSALTGIHDATGELMDALGHLQRSLQRLESRLNDQLQQLDSRMRDRTEQRLRVLTVISSVFMPLTFITGFYGMNFENMPALREPWGYSLVVGLMLAVGIGMALFFRWRGWFR